MAKLKNWVVISKMVKKGREGLIKYSSYLLSQAQHENQEIIQLSSRKNLLRLLMNGDRFDMRNRMNKGGRPANYSQSYSLNFPMELSNETLNKIYKTVMFEFFKYINQEDGLNYSDDELKTLVKEQTFAVIHRGKNVNNHIHILTPRIFKNRSINLNTKKYAYNLKMVTNEVVNQVAGYNYLDYQIKDQLNQKKRKSKHNYKKEKKVKELTAQTAQEVEELFIMLQEQIKAYSNHIEKTGVEIPNELKRLKRAEQQLKNTNTKRALKTLSKSYMNTQDIP